MRALEAERDKVEAGRKQLGADRRQLDADLEKLCEQQDTLRQRLSESLDAHRRDARTEIDTIVDQLRLRASELERTAGARSAAGGPALTTGDAGSLRAAARTALDETIDRAQESYKQDTPSAIVEPSPTAAPATPPPVGSRVTVHSLGLKGTVLAVHKAEAEVEVKGKRLHVRVADLRPCAEGGSAGPAGGRVTTHVEALSRTAARSERDRLHCRRSIVANREISRPSGCSRSAGAARHPRPRQGRATPSHRGTARDPPPGCPVHTSHTRARRRWCDRYQAQGLDVARFPPHFVEDLKAHADIVQVVQDTVPLKKAGGGYKGLCPFHTEKTPSFHVNRDKGFFHCFGCGTGGDVVKFVELQENLSFPEAVRQLAQRFGLQVPETDDPERDAAADARREALLKLHVLATEYFRDQLARPGGARARAHLEAAQHLARHDRAARSRVCSCTGARV